MTTSEQARAGSHACDACIGTGVYRVRGFQEWRCWVCAGVGTISDRMPVDNAVADAETLRVWGKIRYVYRQAWTEPSLVACRRLGEIAIAKLSKGTSEDVAYFATAAARAAFRAVPGLRGDR